MTSYDLKRILAEELARVIPGDAGKRRSKFDYVLPGFGERVHPSGRKSYVLQRTMGGKQRLITIGDAAILSERIAKDVARRLILRIELGQNPADKKQLGRKMPTYTAFLQSYWELAAPTWTAKSTTSIVALIWTMRSPGSSSTRSAMRMLSAGTLR